MALIITLSVLWLPLTLLIFTLVECLNLVFNGRITGLSVIILLIDYTRVIKSITAEKFFIGLIFVTVCYLCKMTFIIFPCVSLGFR